MRKSLKIPRIIKIDKIDGFTVYCMFNNGEVRELDFLKIFEAWNINEKDIEFPLLNEEEFHKLELRNFTLSWPNISIDISDENGKALKLPYEIGADVLFQLSEEVENKSLFRFGKMIKKARIKAGLTQDQLAKRSGTTRFYISKVENEKTDLEVSTLKKIVEAGLGKKLKFSIE